MIANLRNVLATIRAWALEDSIRIGSWKQISVQAYMSAEVRLVLRLVAV
jgi:hypothetical protein